MTPSFRNLLLAIFLLGIVLFAVNAFHESDSFYHLAAGKLIWQTKSIPRTDVFSLTAAGRPWVAHEWLAEVIFYGVYAAAGYRGIMIFCALLAGCAYFLVFRRATDAGGDWMLNLLLLVLVGTLTLELWIGRPQVFAYLLFALELWLLELWRRKKFRPALWLLPLVILLWANMHASVILGLAVLFWYAAAAWLKNRRPEIFGRALPGEEAPRILWLSAGAGFLISFLNPNGYHTLLYSFTVQKALAALRIEEWQPIENYWSGWSSLAFSAELLAIAAFYIWYFARYREKRDLNSLGMVLGAAVLPFIAIRHVGWWPLIAIPPLAEALSAIAPGLWRKLAGRGGPALLAAGLVFAGLGVWRLPSNYYDPEAVPVAAADFIQSQNLPGPFYNHYNFGGYLIWRLWPREKVFMDGRSEVFAGQPMADYLAIARAENWDALVNQKYKLNYFILPYQPADLGRSLSPLYLKLIREGWIFVWWDDTAVIFVRPTAQNLPLAARFAIRYVGPWTDPTAIPPANRRAALTELNNLLNRAPDSLVIRAYTQKVLASLQK